MQNLHSGKLLPVESIAVHERDLEKQPFLASISPLKSSSESVNFDSKGKAKIGLHAFDYGNTPFSEKYPAPLDLVRAILK